jgi:hypothetical protein
MPPHPQRLAGFFLGVGSSAAVTTNKVVVGEGDKEEVMAAMVVSSDPLAQRRQSSYTSP